MILKIKKKHLIFFTGIIWFWAGFLLLHRAYAWVELFSDKQLFLLVIIAISIAVIKIYLIFYKLTVNNINRILRFNEEFISIFKFHAVKDQILIVVMIAGGLLLRHTPSVPKLFLMPVYIGIGIAMFYSSYLYFKFFIKNFNKKK
ncbi:MAG: hypothetical protein DRI94_06600 [Bacteroidetes bacterium]|nr:MAG: hypothetical protein DRI94_06600 [Bacteroidota bacterium]